MGYQRDVQSAMGQQAAITFLHTCMYLIFIDHYLVLLRFLSNMSLVKKVFFFLISLKFKITDYISMMQLIFEHLLNTDLLR